MTTASALLPLRNAVENACGGDVSDATICAMLRNEITGGPQIAALFEDTSLQALARAGRSVGVSLADLLVVYARIRKAHAAINPELDAALHPDW